METSLERDNLPDLKAFSIFVLLLFLALLGVNVLGALFPSYALWGVNYWHWISSPLPLVAFIAAFLLMLPPVATIAANLFRKVTPSSLPFSPALAGTVISLLLFALFFLYRSKAYVYGDGYFILAAAAKTEGLKFFGQLYLQIFSMILYHYAVLGFHTLFNFSAETTFALINSLAGVMGVWALYRISGTLAQEKTNRWFIFLGSLVSGAVALFFGYVEHYTLPLVWMLWSLYYLIRFLQGAGGKGKALLFGVIALGFHLITISYFLVLVFLLFVAKKSQTSSSLAVYIKPFNLVITAASVVAAAVVQLSPLPQVLVPLFPTSDNPYTVLSGAHLLDVFNQALHVAPLPLFLILLSLVSKRLRSLPMTEEEHVLGSVAVVTFLTSFWIDPTLGAPRDWDLLSLYAFPATLWGASRLCRLLSQPILHPKWLVIVIAAGIVHLPPNLIEKHRLSLATERLDFLLQKSPQYQETYQKALRAEVWGTTLRDNVKKPEYALKYFRRRLDADSSSVTSWFCLGDWFVKRKQYDSAAYYLRPLALLQTDNLLYLLRLATVEAELHNYQPAEKIIRYCLSQQPNNYRFLYTAGLIFSESGKIPDAIDFFRSAHRLNPSSADPLVKIGLLFSTQEQYDSAFVYLQQAQKLDAHNESVYQPLVVSLIALGKYEGAKRYLQRYQELFPHGTAFDEVMRNNKK